MRNWKLIGIISALLLQSISLGAVKKDIAQLEISVFIQEQANSLNCSFDWLTVNRLRIGSQNQKGCAFNFNEMSRNAKDFIFYAHSQKTKRINGSTIIMLEVTVQ